MINLFGFSLMQKLHTDWKKRFSGIFWENLSGFPRRPESGISAKHIEKLPDNCSGIWKLLMCRFCILRFQCSGFSVCFLTPET